MELINQHVKALMEGCKERARDNGLRFDDDTLEYIITNQEMTDLQPKIMIPTLYDYWVHDVETLKGRGMYEVYPKNPFETVINTRPAISFYNDNNPDWLNVMIFYHVLGHIDFFQNNRFFGNTWGTDFCGKALTDKRTIAKLRAEKGRWLDYAIEWSRSIDNLVGYYDEFSTSGKKKKTNRLDFYFDSFLPGRKGYSEAEYVKEINRYNSMMERSEDNAESLFIADVKSRYPEFEALFKKHEKKSERGGGLKKDVMQYIRDNSELLQKENNRWMRQVMDIVRETSLIFQPQIRTKIMNEGWASYWHEKLFMQDPHISGNEVAFAKLNSSVTSLSKVGLNPYAIGIRLFQHVKDLGNKGKLSFDFKRIKDSEERKNYDMGTGKGKDLIFKAREELSDFLFINSFLDQEFMDKHKLFVVGKRPSRKMQGYVEYFIQSRKLEDYRDMIKGSLYHPPRITIDKGKNRHGGLYLRHDFEGKPLVQRYIKNTLLGIGELWGKEKPVWLETWEFDMKKSKEFLEAYNRIMDGEAREGDRKVRPRYKKVLYTMRERKLNKKEM